MGVDCVMINRKTKQYVWCGRYYRTMDDEDSRGYKIRTYLEQTFGFEDWRIITDDSREYFMWNKLLDSYSEKGWKDISEEVHTKVEAWEKEKAQQSSFKHLEKLINENSNKLDLILKKLS
jgi:hypothetical protein